MLLRCFHFDLERKRVKQNKRFHLVVLLVIFQILGLSVWSSWEVFFHASLGRSRAAAPQRALAARLDFFVASERAPKHTATQMIK